MDDQQKTALANSFSNIVRQTQTPGVDVQRLAMAFRMTLEQLEAGQPIELQPLFDYLVQEQKVAEQAVLELCVVLKSREQKLNVVFAPAQKQTFLTEEQTQKMVAAFNAKVDRSVGTWEKTGEVGGIPKSTPGTAIPKSQPGMDGLKPKKKRGPTSRVPIYAGILGTCVVGAIVFFTWRQQTSEPEMHEVPPIPDSAGVHCTHLITNGNAAICEIPKSLAASMPRQTLESQAQITKRALGTGVETMMIRTIEDQKIVVLK